MNSSEEPVIIRPKKESPLGIIIVIILLVAMNYLRIQRGLHHPVSMSFWIRIAVDLGILLLVFGSFLYRKNQPDYNALKLTPAGLFKGTTLYRWQEIEEFIYKPLKVFSITSRKKIISWTLRKSSSSRTFGNKSNRILAGYDDCIQVEYYDTDPEDLIKKLNGWKARYSGQPSQVQISGRPGRTVENKPILIKPEQKKLLPILLLIIFLAAYFGYGYLNAGNALRQLHGPEWLAADTQGRIYFTYHGNVYRLNPYGDILEKIIETGSEVSSSEVQSVALDPSGNIYLTDPKSREVRIYSPSGEFIRNLPGQFKENAKIRVDEKRIYLADMDGNRVLALDISTGHTLWTNKGYLIPDSLDFRNNIVYVADKDRALVRLLNPADGHVIKDIKLKLSGYTFGSTILALGNGDLLLAQTYSNNGLIQKFSQDGINIQSIKGPEGFSPVDLTLSSDGGTIVSDASDYSIYYLQGDLANRIESSQLNHLFESDRKNKISLEESTSLFRAGLIFCLLCLIAVFVYFRKSSSTAGDGYSSRRQSGRDYEGRR